MALRSAPYWWVECDRCGVSAQEGSDYTAWVDKDTADIEPDARGWWIELGGEHALCEDCEPPDRDEVAQS